MAGIADPSTVNRYAYAGNDPVYKVDRSGYDWWDPADWDWGEIGDVASDLLNPFADVSACEFATTVVAGDLVGTGGLAASTGGPWGVAA
jgi:hypothetical protein